MSITVPGEQSSATPILAGRASNAGLSKDTRTWIERVRDSLAVPCPGCGMARIDVVRIYFTASVAECRCGTQIAFRADVPGTQKENAARRSALKAATRKVGQR